MEQIKEEKKTFIEWLRLFSEKENSEKFEWTIPVDRGYVISKDLMSRIVRMNKQMFLQNDIITTCIATYETDILDEFKWKILSIVTSKLDGQMIYDMYLDKDISSISIGTTFKRVLNY